MRVVGVGGDGRSHVLAHVLARSADVVVTPGNAGIPWSTEELPDTLDGDLFVISPEAPLVAGIADRLRAQGKLVFGPGADGARLEGSKAWMKDVVARAGVPTAAHGAFSDVEPALEFLRGMKGPWVVKTDGLAAGKGVLVTDSLIEAEDDVKAKLAGISFGDAGRTVVIEEGLAGPELSLLAVCDGHRAVPLAPAQDFKRVGDGDNGPNTGGMGAYSPVPFADDELIGDVMDRFIDPTLARLRSEGIDYRGVLYAGLMLTVEGPRLLEFNVRFGDPEAQVVLPRLETDLAELLHAAAAGDVNAAPGPRFDDGAAVTVVCACQGYPTEPRTGDIIDGIDDASSLDGVSVFCAGVAEQPDGNLVTSGGRVLAVTGQGPDLRAARRRAYEGVARIAWRGMHHRHDIAAAATRSGGSR